MDFCKRCGNESVQESGVCWVCEAWRRPVIKEEEDEYIRMLFGLICNNPDSDG